MVEIPDTVQLAPEQLIDWNHLLDRPALAVDEAALSAAFAGKRIAITGAAGSLGHSLARLILTYRPAQLILIDSHEAGLFALYSELQALEPDATRYRFLLADVRRRRRIAAIFAATQPELLYHLAAYKHVPWAEAQPGEYLDANLGGGLVVIEEAARAGVQRIVYPSTDKAVRPPSLYGATKRIIEAQLCETATATGLQAVATRFVNVLGSQGSVGITFARRIAAGEALPITDPTMTRYWITPQHGSLLLAYGAGAAFREPFTILLPDSGAAVPVIEIAEKVWQQLGQTGEPPFVITGRRPGERTHEELAGQGETIEPGPYHGILEVFGRPALPASGGIAAGISELLAAVEAGTDDATLKERALAWAHTL